MAVIADPLWLRTRIEAGATVRQIANEAGCTDKTVRNTLHRLGIPLPSEARNAAIDLDAVFSQYQAGVPVSAIAASIDVSDAWVRDRVAEHGIERAGPIVARRRRSKFPQLDDPDWLRARLAEVGITRIARQLDTNLDNVKAALARHGIDPPPPRATALERAAWAPDPEVRYRLAAAIVSQAEDTLAAARALQAAAIDDMVSAGFGLTGDHRSA